MSAMCKGCVANRVGRREACGKRSKRRRISATSVRHFGDNASRTALPSPLPLHTLPPSSLLLPNLPFHRSNAAFSMPLLPVATEYHLGTLKAKLAKLRAELVNEASGGGAGKGEGFEVAKSGDSRVVMIGFPSVGKVRAQTNEGRRKERKEDGEGKRGRKRYIVEV